MFKDPFVRNVLDFRQELRIQELKKMEVTVIGYRCHV